MGGNKDLLLLLYIIAADLIRNDLAVLRGKLEDFGQLAILAQIFLADIKFSGLRL